MFEERIIPVQYLDRVNHYTSNYFCSYKVNIYLSNEFDENVLSSKAMKGLISDLKPVFKIESDELGFNYLTIEKKMYDIKDDAIIVSKMNLLAGNIEKLLHPNYVELAKLLKKR